MPKKAAQGTGINTRRPIGFAFQKPSRWPVSTTTHAASATSTTGLRRWNPTASAHRPRSREATPRVIPHIGQGNPVRRRKGQTIHPGGWRGSISAQAQSAPAGTASRANAVNLPVIPAALPPAGPLYRRAIRTVRCRLPPSTYRSQEERRTNPRRRAGRRQ